MYFIQFPYSTVTTLLRTTAGFVLMLFLRIKITGHKIYIKHFYGFMVAPME